MLGTLGFLEIYPSLEDLAIFINKYCINGADVTYIVMQVNSSRYNPSKPGIEANTNI